MLSRQTHQPRDRGWRRQFLLTYKIGFMDPHAKPGVDINAASSVKICTTMNEFLVWLQFGPVFRKFLL